MRSNHEVIAMDREIPDRADGQIQLQGLPMIAVIKRHVNPKLGSGEKQTFALRIFSDCAQECGGGNACGDRLPGCAIIAGSVEQWPRIIDPAAINRSTTTSAGVRSSSVACSASSKDASGERDFFPACTARIAPRS